MSKRAAKIVALMFGLVGNATAGTYSGGIGSAKYPYLIGNDDDIIEMRIDPNDWDKHFLMIADVNMLGHTFTTAVIAPDTISDIYGDFEGIPFDGVFDGDGHIIFNLTIDATGSGNNYLGLFGQISGEQAQVKNVGLENVFVVGDVFGDDGAASVHVGGVCGMNDQGIISNCYAVGSTRGYAHIAGLCGDNYSGTISHCHAIASVSGKTRLGGICGRNGRGTVSKCFAAGSVTGEAGSYDLGGLCGGTYYGKISDCYATASVSGDYVLGGLCGRVYSTLLSNCYATGSVMGVSNRIGGLCGQNTTGIISNCYATGAVSGEEGAYDLGGLCGRHSQGTISHSYATGPVTGKAGSYALGGLCGESDAATIDECFWNIDTGGPNNGLGTPRTTSQMRMMSNFTSAGWDFAGESANGTDDFWRMCVDDVHYPRLSFEYMDSDFVCPDGVNLLDFSIFAQVWQSIPIDANWDSNYDFDGDEYIGAGDLAIVCGQWLEGM